MTSATRMIQRRRRRKERLRAARAHSRRWLILIGIAVALLVILPAGVVLGGAAVVYGQAVSELPSPQETISLSPVIGPTRLYDRTAQTLLFAVQDPLGDTRTWVSLDSLPPYIAQATLLMEDPNFLTTTRFDAFHTLSKLWRNLLLGPLGPDLSITGRLVRNAIDPQPETATVEDRAREIALVAEITRRYTPQQILEWHLNTNYYGNEAYGIEGAAQVYLGKPAAQLTLAEAALLAAIPPAPQYNPVDNPTAALGRQRDALRALLVARNITQTQYDEASRQVIPLRVNAGQAPQVAADFAVYARRQAENILDGLGRDGARLVSRGGLRIVTTLDLDLYLQSECALRAHLAQLGGQRFDGLTLAGETCASAAYLPPAGSQIALPPDDGIITILDVDTGEIKSMVGAAAQAVHQPGLTLLPFVYFEGFRAGNPRSSPATMVLDIPRRFPGPVEGLIYTPANPDGKFYGVLNLRDAMGAGLLPPAVSVAQGVGMSRVLNSAHQIGLNSLNEGIYDLSLLERGGAVSLLDVAYAYSVFAALGEMRGVPVEPVGINYRVRDPVAVLRIEDAGGSVLWEYDLAQTGANCTTLNCTPIFDSGLGYLINDILADPATRWPVLGEGNVLDLSRPAAVVNALSGDKVDNWTVGYTPQYLVGVHLSRADSQPVTLDTFGLQGAAPVWRAVMEYVHARDTLPVTTWTRPDKIVDMTVCDRSGLIPNGNCPTRREIFVQGIQPFQTDTYWQVVEVNTDTGQLATANTPVALRSQRTFFVPPPEAMDWWKANNLPLPPTEYDTVSRPNLLGATQILQPQALAYVGGVIDVRGSMDASNMQYFQLAYGRDVNPAQWTAIGGQQTSFTPGVSLGLWDTTGLDGVYTLRLSVVMRDNTIETAFAQVTVDNVAPVITLNAGDPGKIYQFPADTIITLNADVTDNLALDRVEFYHNGQFIGTDTDWPYGFDWQISRTGTEVFSAAAFDKVGNSASSDITVEVIRSG